MKILVRSPRVTALISTQECPAKVSLGLLFSLLQFRFGSLFYFIFQKKGTPLPCPFLKYAEGPRDDCSELPSYFPPLSRLLKRTLHDPPCPYGLARVHTVRTAFQVST